jgi:DNA-binding transcriptional MerR regulator
MNRFSIKDIENLTGIKAHTIRIWEQRYGILLPKRTPTNIRYYDAGDLKLALRISLLNNHGYKISRIHEMTEPEMNALIQKITDQDFKLQLIVTEMLVATLAMDMDAFEAILQIYLGKHGMEQTVERLIFHFLEKIGLMWMTNHISPAQEHLVSNVIYRKLAAAIEQLPRNEPATGVRVLLFLPEGEIHDLGLLYVDYLLRKYKKKPIYLGPNTPLKEAKYVYDAHKPEYIYIHLTSVVEEFDGNKYLQKASASFPEATVLVSGSMLRSKKYVTTGNMRFLVNLQSVRDALIAL